jgi:glutamate racemase
MQSVFIGVLTAFLYEPISLFKTFVKNKIVGCAVDVAFCVVPFLIYLDLSLKFSFPCFRTYMFLGVVLGFFIERKSFTASDAEIKQACVPAVNFFKDNDCDVIILGCTHFLNISKQIQDVCGTQIKVVDSKEGVVKHAIEVYEQALRLAKPVEGVAKKTGAQVFAKKKLGECAERTRGLWSEGETSPALFITGFNDNEDKKEYDALSKKYNIRFCGNID